MPHAEAEFGSSGLVVNDLGSGEEEKNEKDFNIYRRCTSKLETDPTSTLT